MEIRWEQESVLSRDGRGTGRQEGNVRRARVQLKVESRQHAARDGAGRTRCLVVSVTRPSATAARRSATQHRPSSVNHSRAWS